MKEFEECCFKCGKFVLRSRGDYYKWPNYAKVFLCKKCLAEETGKEK